MTVSIWHLAFGVWCTFQEPNDALPRRLVALFVTNPPRLHFPILHVVDSPAQSLSVKTFTEGGFVTISIKHFAGDLRPHRFFVPLNPPSRDTNFSLTHIVLDGKAQTSKTKDEHNTEISASVE